MKVNVYANPRPLTEWVTVTAFEPDQPETVYTFRLKALDPMQLTAAMSFADDLCRRYVTGGYLDAEGDERPKPEMLPLVDGVPVEVSEDAIILLAITERMQGIKRAFTDDTPVADGYTVPELAAIAITAPTVFQTLSKAVRKLRQGGSDVWRKKGSAVPSAEPYSPLSSEA